MRALLLFSAVIFATAYGSLWLGKHYTRQQRGDRVLRVTKSTNLAHKGFNNDISRYRIDGRETWYFYDGSNFRHLLFKASGPRGWTRVNSRYNDRVSSVRVVRPGSKIKISLKANEAIVENNVQYGGADIRSFRSRGLRDCYNHCRRHKQCMSFTMRKRDRYCWLKRRFNGARKYTNRQHFISANLVITARRIGLPAPQRTIRMTIRTRVLWSAQYNGMYLAGYCSGNHVYNSLRTAARNCAKRRDCGGITYESHSKKYTLRRGKKPKWTRGRDVSWIKKITMATRCSRTGRKGRARRGGSQKYINLALHQRVQQKDTYNGQGVASHAVDGNRNGRWSGKSIAHTRSRNGWWKVTLRQNSYIGYIDIYNRMDCCQQRLRNARVYVDGRLVGTIPQRNGRQKYRIPVKRRGRVVKIQAVSGQVLQLAEVEVYGPANGGRGYPNRGGRSSSTNWIWIRHTNSFLSGYCGGRHFYPNLRLAELACSRRRDCGGITYERRHRRYSLRRGRGFRKSSHGEISWLKRENRDLRGWKKRNNTYLSGYTRGRHFFPNLYQAALACSRRLDCGGITYERHHQRYSLRRGRKYRKSPSGEISWLRGPSIGGGNMNTLRSNEARVENNTDYWGSDIRSFRSGGLRDCYNHCRRQKGCVSFTMRKRDRHCWLKRRHNIAHRRRLIGHIYAKLVMRGRGRGGYGRSRYRIIGGGVARRRTFLIRSYRLKYLKWRRLANSQRKILHSYNVRYNASRKRVAHYARLYKIWVRRANAEARRANALRRSHANYMRRLNAAKRTCNRDIKNIVRAANTHARRQRRYHAKYESYRRRAMFYRRKYSAAHKLHSRHARSRRNAVALYNKYVHHQNAWAKKHNNLRG